MDPTVKTRDFATTFSTPQIRPQFSPPPSSSVTVTEEVPKLPPRPFQDCDLVFAVDISQSTKGRIFAEECAFVENFARNLTARASNCVRVLPWDEVSHKPVKVQQVHTIAPAGRTDPSALLTDTTSANLLQRCHLWFLLTDGEIVPPMVRRFALNINIQRLQGTPCVLVIFGSRPKRPFLCNVSVGISVFGVSPNCIFLFHDVDSHEAYILQCKGCFGVLLSPEREQVSINKDTEWYQLPRLDYTQLFGVMIPTGTTVNRGHIMLQSGKQIKLEDLYRERLSCIIQDEIMSNDDDLKSIMLTATIRGQGVEVRDWITRRRDCLFELSGVPRPDIDGNASTLVKLIVKKKQKGASTSNYIPKLWDAHATNWKAFEALIEPWSRRAAQQGMVGHYALTRLDEIEELGPSSPGSLSPVSPGHRRMERRLQKTDSGPSSKLLYSRGYQITQRSFEVIAMCQICEREITECAILLKRPPDGDATAGFPSPESRSSILFPLAIARYRETDIISQSVCCDPCSVFVIDHGLSPGGDQIVSALMVGKAISLADDATRTTWLTALEKAFERRISREGLLLGALAILYNAIDQATPNQRIRQAYYQACVMIEKYAQVPYEVGNLHWTGPIHDVVSHYISIGVTSPKCDFLSHPVDSFAYMIRPSMIDSFQKSTAVFLRFALHIIEYSIHVQDTQRGDTATEFIRCLTTFIPTWLTIEEGPSAETADFVQEGILGKLIKFGVNHSPEFISVEILCESSVIEETAVTAFRGAGQPFKMIEHDRECKTAICLFICLFGTVNTGCTDPHQILNWFHRRAELENLFSCPWLVDIYDFLHMWESLSRAVAVSVQRG